MRKVTLAMVAMVVFIGLIGCATQKPRYGVFLAPEKTVLIAEMIANDAVQRMAGLYSPANTYILLKQPTTDGFGVIFVAGLREKGYAVSEFNPKGKETKGVPLFYVLDQAGEAENLLYRLTIQAGSQTMSRAYKEQGRKIVPVSYWARKE